MHSSRFIISWTKLIWPLRRFSTKLSISKKSFRDAIYVTKIGCRSNSFGNNGTLNSIPLLEKEIACCLKKDLLLFKRLCHQIFFSFVFGNFVKMENAKAADLKLSFHLKEILCRSAYLRLKTEFTLKELRTPRHKEFSS